MWLTETSPNKSHKYFVRLFLSEVNWNSLGIEKSYIMGEQFEEECTRKKLLSEHNNEM